MPVVVDQCSPRVSTKPTIVTISTTDGVPKSDNHHCASDFRLTVRVWTDYSIECGRQSFFG